MKVVVGGPPQSGKSVFTGALLLMIQDRLGPDASEILDRTTIDLWDDSLPWVLGEVLELPGEGDPDEDDVERHRREVEALDAPLVVSDAPGKIDDCTRTLVEPFDAMIILSSTDDGIPKWKELAGERGVEVVWVLESMDPAGGEEAEWNPDSGSGRFRGCERTRLKDLGIRALPYSSQDVLSRMVASLLERSLGI